jgi:hypothetical protein
MCAGTFGPHLGNWIEALKCQFSAKNLCTCQTAPQKDPSAWSSGSKLAATISLLRHFHSDKFFFLLYYPLDFSLAVEHGDIAPGYYEQTAVGAAYAKKRLGGLWRIQWRRHMLAGATSWMNRAPGAALPAGGSGSGISRTGPRLSHKASALPRGHLTTINGYKTHGRKLCFLPSQVPRGFLFLLIFRPNPFCP